MICWPEKIDTYEDATEVLRRWAGMIWALLVSQDIKDINKFHDPENPNWIEDTIEASGVITQVHQSE